MAEEYEEDEEEYDEEFLIEEISREEYKRDKKESIIESAEKIKINAGIISRNFPSELAKLLGGVITIDAKLSELGDLIENYSTSCSEEETIKEKRVQGEEAQGLVYYRDSSGKTDWAFPDSEEAYFLKNIKKKEEKDSNMYV